jgi:DNA-binding beta-propeller fold protein YncE
VLNEPFGLAVDAAGNLFIADSGNNRIRKVSASTGVITTVAGVGEGGGLTTFAGDGGPATSAWLNQPFGLAVDASGNLFIADSGNDRIRALRRNVWNPAPIDRCPMIACRQEDSDSW